MGIAKLPPFERQLFDIPRRIIAYKTSEAWESTPHVSACIDLDVTRLVDFVSALSADPEYDGVRITLNSVILKMIAESLKAVPEMNAHISYSRRTGAGELLVMSSINIAMPFLSKDRRMMTPVLPDVGTKTLREVCVAMDDLKRRAANTNIDCLLFEAAMNDTWERLGQGDITIVARLLANFVGKRRVRKPSAERLQEYRKTPLTERISAEELLTATVLVSNVGSITADLPLRVSLIEIIAPQTCAIGVAAARKQPLVVEDEHGRPNVAVRTVLPVTVCFDHRAMDFEHAATFFRSLSKWCRTPERLVGTTDDMEDAVTSTVEASN